MCRPRALLATGDFRPSVHTLHKHVISISAHGTLTFHLLGAWSASRGPADAHGMYVRAVYSRARDSLNKMFVLP